MKPLLDQFIAKAPNGVAANLMPCFLPGINFIFAY
jgi:hypothetical protein